MKTESVRAPQSTPAALHVASADPSPSLRPGLDGYVSPPERNYLVFADKPLVLPLLRKPEAKGYQLRGISPTGERWTTARLSEAEALSLRQSGLRVVEDHEVGAPPQPVVPDVIEPANVFARDVHQLNELNALGPAFEGEGGLFVSVDSGVALHRDLPPTIHFDSIFTEALEDPQSDSNKHGTHTSGSAVARGNPAEGGIRGMAPRAQLAAVQVLDSNNRGTVGSTLRGIERAVDFARLHPDAFVVVNVSIAARPRLAPADDPMVQAIERATREHGILFTLAAGNTGPELDSIQTPGTAPAALTFGAMVHSRTRPGGEDYVARFSARDREGGPKPNLVARGYYVRSTVPNDRYESLQGTSMAAPIGGGASLALGQGLLEMYRRGELRVDPRELVKTGQFQAIIEEAATDNPEVLSHVEGSGDLRIMNAYRLFVDRFATRSAPPAAPVSRE